MAVCGYKKDTLLQKYDIPIDHLSFHYVDKCNDPKELERIVKVLRSGEEGYYSELLQSFEAKLARIMPGSRLLKVSQPLRSTQDNGYEFYMQTIEEIKELRKEAESYREEGKYKSRKNAFEDLPAVRTPGKITFSQNDAKGDEQRNSRTEVNKAKSVVPRNYAEWEKYDADRELLRMDLEEERAKERNERKQKHKLERKKEEEMQKVSIADGGGDYEYTKAEKVFMASQQKERGNEYFKAGDHQQAIEHYNAAIVLDPTPIMYNNRAIAYIKLNKYEEAVSDCNKVLEAEPDNVKALMRRGVAYQNQDIYQKALDDFTRVTLIQPHNLKAHSLAMQMQEMLGGNKKVVRMKIEDGSPVKRSNKSFFKSWDASGSLNIEYNEFGLPKIVCNCSGMPDWVRNHSRQNHPDSSSDDEGPCELAGESMETSETEEYSSSSMTSRLRENVESAKLDSYILSSDDFEVEKGSGDVGNKEKTEDSSSDIVNFSEVLDPYTVNDEEFNSLLPDLEDPLKVDTCENWDDEPMQAEGLEDLSLEDDSVCSITTPFEFINAWQNVKNKYDPIQFASVLRRIVPGHLHFLVGNKMDGHMLSTMLHCLEKAFLNEPDFVLGFLRSITQLDRFDLIKCFLNKEDKAVIMRIFETFERSDRPLPLDLEIAFLR